MTKPCPERSEGTLEIAVGYALATTFGRIATPGCRNTCLHKAFRRRQALRRAGTLPLVARNDEVKTINAFVLAFQNSPKTI